jgi:hypothetical protein
VPARRPVFSSQVRTLRGSLSSRTLVRQSQYSQTSASQRRRTGESDEDQEHEDQGWLAPARSGVEVAMKIKQTKIKAGKPPQEQWIK